VESKKCGVCSDLHQSRVFIGPWGRSTNLAEVVTRQVAVVKSSHMAGRPGGSASTYSSFSSSCRHVATKARAEPLETLAGRPRRWADRLAPGPVHPGFWPTQSICQIHPRGDNDFDIWSTSLCYPYAPIWYLCSWNLINAKIVELGQ
jgi:hypothetical protein